MKKIFRLANAELSKIFMRPSMFVLFTVIVVALVLSFMFFKPSEVNTKFTYDDGFTNQIYLNFQGDYQEFESKLINVKKDIELFLDEDNDTATVFKLNFQSMKDQFYVNLYNVILNSKKPYPSESDLSQLVTEFSVFKTNVKNLKDFMLEKIKDKYTNLFITKDDYTLIYKTLGSIGDNIPSQDQIENFSIGQIMERYNLIKNSYDIDGLNQRVNKLEKIEISSDTLSELLDKYYYSEIEESGNGGEITYSHTGKLKTLFEDVVAYYDEVGPTSDNVAISYLNDRIAKFYDYINICSSLISNNFELLRIGNKSDDQIASYNGFKGISSYNLKTEIATYEYFYNNNTFGYEYLRAYNFGTNSGTKTNAYDFCFYSMQIISFLITLFVIFFACGTLSGEQTSGTLKMIATRPYTRNKIYSGKFLACFNVALLLLTVSLVASFIVGVALYGFTIKSVLVVVNAKTVLTLNSILVMFIYLLSVLLDIIFYIALAILISMIFKQTVLSTAITSAILMASTIISGISNASWIRFIPSLNTGIYKFFTSSKLGIFSFNIVPNVTLLSSALILILSIVFIDIFGRFLFTNRSIDK